MSEDTQQQGCLGFLGDMWTGFWFLVALVMLISGVIGFFSSFSERNKRQAELMELEMRFIELQIKNLDVQSREAIPLRGNPSLSEVDDLCEERGFDKRVSVDRDEDGDRLTSVTCGFELETVEE